MGRIEVLSALRGIESLEVEGDAVFIQRGKLVEREREKEKEKRERERER